jgi:hypothetical protein
MNERRVYEFEFQLQSFTAAQNYIPFLPLIMSAVTQSIYIPGTFTFHASSTITFPSLKARSCTTEHESPKLQSEHPFGGFREGSLRRHPQLDDLPFVTIELPRFCPVATSRSRMVRVNIV